MKKILISCLIVVILIGMIVIWHPLILTQCAHFFTVNNATKGADVLVVLSGNTSVRLPYAIELYQQGYAPQILLTDEKPLAKSPKLKPSSTTSLDRALRVLKRMEVQLDLRMVQSTTGGATSTFDEAHDLLKYSLQHNLKHIILVTDTHHTRRSLLAFKKVFKKNNVLVEVTGAPNAIFHESNWWQSDYGISEYVLEAVKYTVYFFSTQDTKLIQNY